MNYFRQSLKVMGTPIRIQFKEGETRLRIRKRADSDPAAET